MLIFMFVQCGSSSGSIMDVHLARPSSTDTKYYNWTYDIRAAISLKTEGITIVSGDGKTPETAYVLGK